MSRVHDARQGNLVEMGIYVKENNILEVMIYISFKSHLGQNVRSSGPLKELKQEIKINSDMSLGVDVKKVSRSNTEDYYPCWKKP
jgi:hypothetical protein